MARSVSTFVSALLFLTSLISLCPATASDAALARRDSSKEPKATVFNGKDVPPLIDLNGSTYKDRISSGYWLVKAFSPYCGHCLHLAPKWQTLYEYYYSSTPPGPTDTHDNFTTYYGLNFAALDCVAFGSACTEIGVQSFPTMALFKDGTEIHRMGGDRDMETLAAFIEACLEKIKPGSRPKKEDLEFPKVGATSFYPAKLPPQQVQPATSPQDSNERQSGSPNPDGISYPFTDESFNKLQINTLDPWFVKFYHPSCPHCRQMEASWDSMAREMKGKLNVGQINCATETKLCGKMGVKAYPTIKLFRGPEHITYHGLRGLGDFLDFAKRAVEAAAGVNKVTTSEFEELEKKEEVLFLYLYNHATTSEDFKALDRLPLHLIGHAKVVKSDDESLAKRFNVFNWPHLLVSRDGVPSYFEETAPHEMRNVSKVRKWMESVWLPLVPELTAANAHELMDNKLVVLAILSRDRKEQFALARRELKASALEWKDRETQEFNLELKKLRDAKRLRVEEAGNRGDARAIENAKMIPVDKSKISRKSTSFAWVDGVFWERWTRTTYGVSVAHDGEKIIINDQATRRYWDTTSTGNPIVPSITSILETLNLVTEDPPGIPSKLRGYRLTDWYLRMRKQAIRRPWLAACTATAFLTTLVVFVMRIRRRARRNFGSNGFMLFEDKVAVGNGNLANGKVD